MEIRSSKLLKLFNDNVLFLEDFSRRCTEDVEEEFKCNNLKFWGIESISFTAKSTAAFP